MAGPPLVQAASSRRQHQPGQLMLPFVPRRSSKPNVSRWRLGRRGTLWGERAHAEQRRSLHVGSVASHSPRCSGTHFRILLRGTFEAPDEPTERRQRRGFLSEIQEHPALVFGEVCAPVLLTPKRGHVQDIVEAKRSWLLTSPQPGTWYRLIPSRLI